MTRPLPAGRYFSVIGSIRQRAGGQTRVLLMRHRLFATQRGVDMPILTFNPTESYDPIRESLARDGLLLPTSRIINMHEDLRTRDLSGLPTVPVDGETGPVAHDRADGSTYLQTPEGPDGLHVVRDRDGRAVATTATLGGLWRWWAMLVAGTDQPVYFVSDSRFIAEELSLIDSPDVYVLHQMHAVHTVGERRWTSRIGDTYVPGMDTLSRLDAFGILTRPQRDDVARRFGETDNLVVVPNPVEPTVVPDPLPARTPERIVVIGRLHHHKRMDRAVEAFALLAARRPLARLDIYGSGPDLAVLQQQVADAGLGDRVTLHGHDPRAADELWSADVAWLTGAFEGFGLFILEARARACPVLSFDVPYGPREQIVDGVDGVLVAPADTAALADATSALFDDRARLEAMRPLCQAAAGAYSFERFLDDWAGAVEGAVARKPHRVLFDDVRLTGTRLDLPGKRDDAAHRLALSTTVDVTARGDLGTAEVTWQAYVSTSPEPVVLPATVTRDGSSWHLEGVADPGTVADLLATGLPVTVRVMVVCRNSGWHEDLHVGPLRPTRHGRLRSVVRPVVRRLRRVED